MRTILFRIFVLMTGAAALSGCGGGAIDSLVDIPPPPPAAVIDESVLATNDGTAINPYVLPTKMPADTDGGVYDYLNWVAGGYWNVGYSGLQVDLGVATPTFGDLVYDEANDQWLLTVDTVEYTLKNKTIKYSTNCSGPKTCAGFAPYADPSKTLYGIFGYIGYDDKADKKSIYVMHTGLKTQTTDMPTGSASYSGVFAGALTNGPAEYAVLGDTTIGVDFGATADQVTFSSGGNVYDTAAADVGDYTLGGLATISGNTYVSSTITGTSTGAVTEDNYTGALDAAFYGPGAVQTAGAEVVTGGVSGSTLGGGYWAEK